MRARATCRTSRLLLLSSLLLSACEAAPRPPSGSAAPNSPTGGRPELPEGPQTVVLGSEARRVAGIATARARTRRLAPELTTTGEVGYEEDRLAHVGPRIRGRVADVPVSLGDSVRQDQVLATLDSVELGEAKADYLAARAHEEVAREAFEREQALARDRISSRSEMLEARGRFLEAEAERERARETLRLYGVDERTLAAMSAGGSAAWRLQLRAPIAGTIVAKHAAIGELATPEKSLFTIADLGRVWVWIDIFERDLARVHQGDGVEVRVDAFPERIFTGEVTYLSSEVASDTRTVRARIDAENPERLLRPGMFATVRLTDPHATEGAESVVVLAAAIVRTDGRQIVFRPAGEGRFVATPVETGRRDGDDVEVIEGLTAGDEVVTAGTFFLKAELARDELGGGHGH